MRAIALGIATASALLSLIPSKKEDQMDVPYPSIGFALMSGVMVVIGLSY
jgi:hypothetical protein